tara:strand:+ start:52 stop:705 length:654 start_codon:yes stop_codon:yes gene_type:complete
MAIIPSNTQFRGDTTGVPIVEKGSSQTQGRAGIFTMADIAQSAGPITDNTVYGLDAFTSNVSGAQNTAVGSSALSGNTTGNNNTALGSGALQDADTGINNTALGGGSLFNCYAGNSNIAIGKNSAGELTTGSFNTIVGGEEFALEDGNGNSTLGHAVNTGNFNHSVILGREAAAVADNQFSVGSSTYNAGSVATETNTSSKVWNVVINGVAQKILLA